MMKTNYDLITGLTELLTPNGVIVIKHTNINYYLELNFLYHAENFKSYRFGSSYGVNIDLPVDFTLFDLSRVEKQKMISKFIKSTDDSIDILGVCSFKFEYNGEELVIYKDEEKYLSIIPDDDRDDSVLFSYAENVAEVVPVYEF